MGMMTKTSILTQSANTIGNVAAGGTIGGGGILYAMGQNAPAIGAVCVVIGLVATIIFKLIAHREVVRHHREIEDGPRDRRKDDVKA
jgi:hypothetical protein